MATTTAPDEQTTPESSAAEAESESTHRDGPPSLEERVIEAIRTVYDPEIPVNIYEMGLIYTIDIDEAKKVWVKMTLTSPGCPVAGTLPGEVQDTIAGVAGVESAEVEIVWDPEWNPSMMSEAARLDLGMM